MINQLFRERPDKDFIIKLLNCFDLKDLNDTTEFTKDKLNKIKTIDKINNLLPELVIYYLPCKYNMFLKNITINRCITILKQNLKIFNYKLKKREHVINKNKVIYYCLYNNVENDILIENNNPKKCIVSFN